MPHSNLNVVPGKDGLKVEKGSKNKPVPKISKPLDAIVGPESTPHFSEQEVQDANRSIESGTLLRDLCAEIKSDQNNPIIQAHTDKLTSNLTRALDKSAIQHLRQTITPKGKLNDSMQYAIQWGVHSYFKDLSAQFGVGVRRAATELQQSSYNFSENNALCLASALAGGVKDIQDGLITMIMKSYAGALQDHAQELEGLPDQEYKEKILSIQKQVIQKIVNDNLINIMPKVIDRISQIVRNSENSPIVSDEFKKSIRNLSDKDLRQLADKYFAKPILEGQIKLDEMAGNIAALTYQRAQIHVEDSGTKALLNDLNHLDKMSAGIVVGRVLRNLANRSGSPAYNFAVNIVREKYPEVKHYIADWRTYAHSEHHYVFSQEGVQKLVEMLSAKGRLGETPCFVETNYEPRLLDWIKNSTANGSISFVNLNYKHYQPIFAEKKDGRLRIFAPVGIEKDCIRTIANSGIPCIIFKEKSEMHRQHDNSSCPVFSLRDISQLSRHPDLLDQMEKGIDEEKNMEGSVSVHDLTSLPASLMNSAQSLIFIDEYDSAQKTTVRGDLQSKGKIVRRPLLYQPLVQKNINVTMSERRLKYEEVMYSAVIAGVIGS